MLFLSFNFFLFFAQTKLAKHLSLIDICPFHLSALPCTAASVWLSKKVKNDQLYFTDIVFLCTHVPFLIEDSVRWIAGKWGDWQVTGLSLIRHQSIIEVLTLTFSAINPIQPVCVDFIFLWQGLWYPASGQVRAGDRGPVKRPPTAQQITLTPAGFLV